MGATTDHLPATLRRIDTLEADRRRVQRSLSRCTPGSPLAVEMALQRDELDKQLGHWRGIIAEAEADGFKIWSRKDFTRGDFVEYQEIWYEVLRVNLRSVTVPHIHRGSSRGVVCSEGRLLDRTWIVGYHDGVTGRMSVEEMARRLDKK